MNQIYYFITIIIIILLFLYFFTCIEFFTNNKYLTFSNTEKWGDDELNSKNYHTKTGKYLLDNAPRISNPANNSFTTQTEIDDILHKQHNITHEKIVQMEKELYLDNIYHLFETTPQEASTFNQLFEQEINYVIFNLKHEYNRVRPYTINSKVKTYITKPKHPSYPSGHSTQAYFIANVMSNKYPENKDKYFNTANEIAVNREYGGFHYTSDTQYGKILAKYLSDFYLNHTTF